MESIAKLKWRCRRGTKELDYLLLGYVESQFDLSPDEEKRLFLELLSLPDTELIHYLLGEQQPESKRLATLVKTIRNNPNI